MHIVYSACTIRIQMYWNNLLILGNIGRYRWLFSRFSLHFYPWLIPYGSYFYRSIILRDCRLKSTSGRDICPYSRGTSAHRLSLKDELQWFIDLTAGNEINVQTLQRVNVPTHLAERSLYPSKVRVWVSSQQLIRSPKANNHNKLPDLIIMV